MEKAPVHLLQNLENLIPKYLEKKLLESSDHYRDGNWSRDCQKRGIFIDLSQVRWVHLGAAHQLVLFIENARKSNLKICIALPSLSLSYGSGCHDSKNKLDERIDANKFLKTIRFDIVTLCSHLDTTHEHLIKITEKYKFASDLNFPIDIEAYKNLFDHMESGIKKLQNFDRQTYYKNLCPLTWLKTRQKKEQKKEQSDDLKLVRHILNNLENTENSIQPIDIEDINNIILYELKKNVRQHAGNETNHALFSMILVSVGSYSEYYKKHYSEKNDIEYDYICWLLEQSNKFKQTNKYKKSIEIYFGDSGSGILNSKLQKAYKEDLEVKNKQIPSIIMINVLKWAFNKFSTSKPRSKIKETDQKEPIIRGTKGLFRIKKLISKYNGIVLVRNKNIQGGYQKGNYNRTSWVNRKKNDESLYYHTGTFIQFKLCSYNDVVGLNFSFDHNNDNYGKWGSYNYTFDILKNHNPDFKQIKNLFKTDIEIYFKKNINLIIMLDVSEKLKKHEDLTKNILEASLLLIAYLREYNRQVLVYFTQDLGNLTQQLYIESVSELIKNDIESEVYFEDKFDPIIVIGRNNYYNWYGKNTSLTTILNELINKPKDERILEKLSSYSSLSTEEQRNIKIQLYEDEGFISLSDKNEITLNLSYLPQFYHNKINQKLLMIKEDPVITPMLKIVKKWISITQLIPVKEKIEYSLALYFLIKEKVKFNNIYPNTKILIDHKVQQNLATQLAKLLGINHQINIVNSSEEIDHQIPKRTKLFSKHDKVIILTTIISSSETIRGLIKHVLRDYAEPLFVLCLINSREKNITEITTWEKELKIISIYEKLKKDDEVDVYNMDEEQTIHNQLVKKAEMMKQTINVIEPDFETQEIKNIKTSENIVIKSTLKDFLITKKALHYNHIGNLNNRHYTFYLNKETILCDDSDEFILNKFKDKIYLWIKETNLQNKKINLIIPKKKALIEDAISKIANKLLENEGLNIISIDNMPLKNDSMRLKENIVFLDFGSLTGHSINNFINNVESARNIYICILFSQFKNGECGFYTKLSSFKNGKNNFLQTPFTNLKIEFIDEIPLSYYHSTNCPICEHIRILDKFKGESEFINDFVDDRKPKLKIKSRTEIHPIPTDFYPIEDKPIEDYELSSQLIMDMFEFSQYLIKSQHSTSSRVIVFEYIYSAYKKMNASPDYLRNPNSKIYAILFFLSMETHWMQKEPLVYRATRAMITAISKKISLVDMEEYVKYFDYVDYSFGTNPFYLATRYKLAAITVLRSSNKHEFCRSVSKIIFSSVFNKNLSNNLSQNTFFHINSILTNNYNKSIDYFLDLETNLKNILDAFSDSETVFKTIEKLKNKIYSRLSEIDLSKIKDNLKKLKYIRDQILKLNKIPIGNDHSKHDEAFKLMHLFPGRIVKQVYDDLLINPTNCSETPYVKSAINTANDKKNLVFEYIKNISDSLNQLGDKLKTSISFNEFINETLHTVNTVKIQEISEFLNCSNNDIKYFIENNTEYNTNLDVINKLFFTYNKINPKILDTINNYSSEIICQIKEIFSENEFNVQRLNFKGESTVFYPQEQMKGLLNQIKENIGKHLSIKDTRGIEVIIEINNLELNNTKQIELSISNYICTNVKKNLKKFKIENENGGLKMYSDDIEKFGGKFKYDYIKKNSNIYFLNKLTMRKYE